MVRDQGTRLSHSCRRSEVGREAAIFSKVVPEWIMRIPEGVRWKATGQTLGSGGQGTVVQVVDRSAPDGPKYALKGLSKGRTEEAYRRFEREVKATQSLDHPGIVRVTDWSLDPEFPYLVMEFVEGATSLKKLLQNKANPYYARPIPALGFFRQLLQVISACESLKGVHRDLSPANVLILPNEKVSNCLPG